MTKPENIEIIKSLIDEILKKMGFLDFTVGIREEAGPDGENLVFNIVTQESDLMIGQFGVNLQSLQHLLRAVARKKIEERLRFSVDVNNYRRQKMASLEETAKSFARQAIIEKRPVVLRPMSAYERRIIHMTLSGNDQVKTESIGEGEDRKVVIKPVGSIETMSTGE
ncbi:MAG: R3H domain-containing nucleic acid-binding protein [Parcubacteria group bacterium]|jgi:spoIIIJ-associated protein